MRLFVALPVDEAVRERLLAATARVRTDPDGASRDEATSRQASPGGASPGWRWTRPEGWHITLAFLGEVDDDRVGQVADVAGRAVAGTGSVELALREAGRLGRGVLQVAVTDRPAGVVARLGAALQDALAAAELPVQQREVVPHLTLARARRRTRPSVPELAVPDLSWSVTEARLHESRLHPHGARYEVRARLPLG